MNGSNLFACLPLKTGTTNWQKSLVAVQYYEQTGRYLDPIFVHGVYLLLPRYYLSGHHQFNSPDGINCMEEILKAESKDPSKLSWMNVRHPFARLLSAWRNKFSKTFNSRDQYMKKYSKSWFSQFWYHTESVAKFWSLSIEPYSRLSNHSMKTTSIFTLIILSLFKASSKWLYRPFTILNSKD